MKRKRHSDYRSFVSKDTTTTMGTILDIGSDGKPFVPNPDGCMFEVRVYKDQCADQCADPLCDPPAEFVEFLERID